MFISRCDKVCWRVIRFMWPMNSDWRYRLKLVLVFFKALWQQERFIFESSGINQKSGEKKL